MNVLIVEDEYHAAERLRNQLKSLDQQIEVLGVAPSIAEAVKLLQVNPPDLVFLDIQLSDGLCFGIFEKVIPKWPVIFTTAYDQYAIKAFELHSIAYLLKPIKKEELAAGLLKFHQMRQLFQADVDLIARDMVAGTKYFKKRFLVEVGNKIKTIVVEDIAYFFAMDKMVFLMQIDGQRIPIDYSLDRLEPLLNPTVFFRINRKFIIQMKSIASMSSYSRNRMKLTLKPCPDGLLDTLVSIEKAASFREWLDQ